MRNRMDETRRNRRQRSSDKNDNNHPDSSNDRIVRLSREEAEKGYRSGDLLPVYDLADGKSKLIKRDGYYPPEELSNFVNLEEFVMRERRNER